MALPAIDIEKLTPDERLELIERLWDSLGPAANAIPLTPAQREEVDRRVDDIEQEGPTGAPLDEVVRRLRSSR